MSLPLFRLTFTPPDGASPGEVVDAADRLLSALKLGGHIPATSPPAGWQDGRYTVYLNLIAPDALDAPYLPAAALQCLQAAGVMVIWTDLSADTDPPPPEAPDALMLFSSLFWEGSAVSDLERRPVPPYRLGLSPLLSQKLYQWARRYAALDRLYIDSGALEPEALSQLTDPAAALLTEGRALAAAVEAHCGTPTYTYLLHPDPYEARPCPGCGQPWSARPGEGLVSGVCHPCRLVTSGA